MKIQVFREVIDRFYKNKRFNFYILFILSFIAGLFELIGLVLIYQFVLFLTNSNNNLYSKSIIKFFQNNFNIEDFSKIGLILGLTIASIYILKNIYMFFYTVFYSSVLRDLSQTMINKTINNLIYQDYLTLKSIPKDEKLNALSKINVTVWEYCQKYIVLITNLTIIVVLIAALFIKFTKYAIIASTFLGLLSLLEYKFFKSESKKISEKILKFHDTANASLLPVIHSIVDIKLNNKEDYFSKSISNINELFSKFSIKKHFSSIFHIYFNEITIMLTFSLILILLFYTNNFNNQLILSSLSTICVIILRLTPCINRTQSSLYLINTNEIFAIKFLEYDKKFKQIEYKNTKEKLPFNSSIEIINGNFSYPNSDEKFSDINLKINKNDFIGIIGKSGSYKTTLMLLISGLIRLDCGQFRVDYNNLNEIDFKKWRNNFSILSQNYNLIFDKVKDNFKNKDYPKEIFKKLEIDNLINKNVSELSNGQKQRLALALTLNQDKEIIILDEATSAIDVLSEEKINEILFNLKGKKTIISIAHRLQILKHCNKIIYMDENKIIDIGTFNYLKEKYSDFEKIIKLSSFKST